MPKKFERNIYGYTTVLVWQKGKSRKGDDKHGQLRIKGRTSPYGAVKGSFGLRLLTEAAAGDPCYRPAHKNHHLGKGELIFPILRWTALL